MWTVIPLYHTFCHEWDDRHEQICPDFHPLFCLRTLLHLLICLYQTILTFLE
jgi:hypothetical protein